MGRCRSRGTHCRLRMQLTGNAGQGIVARYARLIGLIPGVATQAGARNGFAEPRDRVAKIAVIAPPGSAETARPRLNRGKARKSGPIRQTPGNVGR